MIIIFCEGGKVRGPVNGRVGYAKHKRRFEFPFEQDRGLWLPMHLTNLGDVGSSEEAILAGEVDDLGGSWEEATSHRWVKMAPEAVPVHKAVVPGRVARIRGQNDVFVSRARGGVRKTRRGFELDCKAHAFDRDGLYSATRVQFARVLDVLAEQGVVEIEIGEFKRCVERFR